MDARTEPISTAAAAPAARRPVAALRRRLFSLFGVVVLVAAIGWGLYWVLVASHHVTTNDAYVQADVTSVTPLINGPVIQAPAKEALPVAKGDVLVVIDPTDFKLALAEARATLDQTQRRVRGYFANVTAQAAVTAARDADIARSRSQLSSAMADFARAQTDLTRRQALAADGAVSGDEITAAQNRFDQAKDAVGAARAALAQAEADRAAAVGQQQVANVLVSGAGVEDNPEVAAARARVEQAQLDLDRTVIRAPVAGVVAKNVVDVGQRVQAGAQLMTIVPIQDVYVNANFKEAQLRRMHVGQAVTLTSDLWGAGVKFHGTIVGLAGGTGAAFSVIPAQNATGNWIKVVQRLPVRIALRSDELVKHPLRVGLSMTVDVDTAN